MCQLVTAIIALYHCHHRGILSTGTQRTKQQAQCFNNQEKQRKRTMITGTVQSHEENICDSYVNDGDHVQKNHYHKIWS